MRMIEQFNLPEVVGGKPYQLEKEAVMVETLRVYPVAKRPAFEIEADMSSGKKVSEISFNSVIFVHENTAGSDAVDATPSAGHIRPLVERLEPGEDIFHGARRVLAKQVPFTLSNFPPANKTHEGIWMASAKFDYSIQGSSDTDTKRTSLVALEVNRTDTELSNVIMPDKYKDAQVVYLPTAETVKLVQGGLDIPIIGSSVIGPSSDIKIDDENNIKKDTALGELCQELAIRESNVHARLLQRINIARQQAGQEEYTDLDQATPAEVIQSFQKLRVEESMGTFREQKGIFDKKGYDRAIAPENLGRWLGTDLIYFAQVVAGNASTEDLSVWKARSTKDIVAMSRFLRDVLRTSFGEIIDSQAQFKRYFAEVNQAATPVEASAFFLKKVEQLYQDDNLTLLSDDFDTLMSAKLTNILAKSLGIKKSEVAFVMKQVEELLTKDVDNALSSDPAFYHNRQLHRMSNEVNNASLATLFFQTLGIRPDKQMDRISAQICQFESARSLAHVLKGLSVLPYYRKLQESNGVFDKIVRKTFGPITETKVVDMPLGQQVLYYRGKDIVDKKPNKDFSSFLRKSLQEPVEKIYDFVSFNVASGDQFVGLNLSSAQEQIDKSNASVNKLMDKIKTLYGERYDYSIVKDTNSYEGLLNYLASRENGSQVVISNGGKRSGSQAEVMPRRKLVLCLREKSAAGNSQSKVKYAEFAFYPFFNLEEQTDNHFKGFWGKLGDDGDYSRRRIIEPLRIGIDREGFPSYYELIYPKDKISQSSPVHQEYARR